MSRNSSGPNRHAPCWRRLQLIQANQLRYKLQGELLNPAGSVLIATIDEKEYLRLGLLLEQTFPDSEIQMVSNVINPKGTARGNEFARIDEFEKRRALLLCEAPLRPVR